VKKEKYPILEFDDTQVAAFLAVVKFRNVKLGQILYGGDDLSGVDWDS
jgi:uridine phosphorylase